MIKSILSISALLILSANLIAAQEIPEPPLGYPPHVIQSLFTEDHRNGDFDAAVKWGRYLVKAHPKEMPSFPGNYRGDRNIQRMIDIYLHKSGQTNDPTLRSAYLDSVAIMYDLVFKHFEDGEINEFDWIMRRGRFFQENAAFIEDGFRRAYDDYYTLFQKNPKRATEAGNGYYIQIILTDLTRRGEQDKALEMIEKTRPYAGQNLLSFFEETRNELFSDPDERIVFLEERRRENPDDIELMEELLNLYKQVNNEDQVNRYAVMLYERNPTYDNIMRLANSALSNAEYLTAIEYLRESIDKTNDARKKRAAALQISDNYLNLRNLEQARNYAQKALEYDSSWGQPYLKIAEIYGEAVRNCAGGEMSRQDRVVYWLVLDYLEKARNVDPSASRSVNRMYSTYKAVTPSREDMFYQGWDSGDKIRIDNSLKGCYAWINEETTIRSN